MTKPAKRLVSGERPMHKALCAALFLVLATSASVAQSTVPPDVVKDLIVKDLAPTGRLRAAINAGNVVLVQKDAAAGVSGITVDLARELGRRLGVPVDLIVYDTAGKVTEAAKTGAWDIGFIAIEPVRAALIGFTAPYVIIEGTYMVPVDSPLKTIADVDHDGVRIAVARG
jgi:polar amino acid transport system substrate-binding protein